MGALILIGSALCGEIDGAVWKRDLVKARALLQNNPALVFQQRRYGLTPLHVAVVSGHKDSRGIAPSEQTRQSNTKDAIGDTPVHFARQRDIGQIAVGRQGRRSCQRLRRRNTVAHGGD